MVYGCGVCGPTPVTDYCTAALIFYPCFHPALVFASSSRVTIFYIVIHEAPLAYPLAIKNLWAFVGPGFKARPLVLVLANAQ